MKKSLLTTSLIAAFFLSCVYLNGAMVVETLYVKASEPKKFILNTADFKSETIKCSIIANDGVLVYTDNIQTATEPARLFDMSQLPLGSYIVELEDELKISRYQLDIAKSAIQIGKEMDYLYKPVFTTMGDDKIGVTMLTLGQTIKIEFSDNEENLHTLIIKDDQSISKVFDLSNLPRGTYQFRVSTNNRSFYHKVNI